MFNNFLIKLVYRYDQHCQITKVFEINYSFLCLYLCCLLNFSLFVVKCSISENTISFDLQSYKLLLNQRSNGFLVPYMEHLLLKLLHMLSFLGFIRKLISILFTYLGPQELLEPNSTWTDMLTIRVLVPLFVSALLICKILLVVKFSYLLTW